MAMLTTLSRCALALLRPFKCSTTASVLRPSWSALYSSSQPVRDDDRAAPRAPRSEKRIRSQTRYRRSPEVRKSLIEFQRLHYQQPGVRECAIERSRISFQQRLDLRRALHLSNIVFRAHPRSRQAREGWTWPKHKPVLYPERVDHRCVSCRLNRFLKKWWQSTDRPDRWTCNYCFANDWPAMVPTTHGDRDLPLVFLSPACPPPPEDRDMDDEDENATATERDDVREQTKGSPP